MKGSRSAETEQHNTPAPRSGATEGAGPKQSFGPAMVSGSARPAAGRGCGVLWGQVTAAKPVSSAVRITSTSLSLSTSGGDKMMLGPETRTMAPA